MTTTSDRENFTQDELMAVIDYNPSTGIFTWIKSVGTARPGQVAGYVNNEGYQIIRFKGHGYLAHRLAIFYMKGSFPDDVCDHINGIPTDNRLANLRECSFRENLLNSRVNSDSLTGIKGVTFNKSNRKYEAKISCHGKKYMLGSFDNPEDAHAAYKAEAVKLFGEFANFGNGCVLVVGENYEQPRTV